MKLIKSIMLLTLVLLTGTGFTATKQTSNKLSNATVIEVIQLNYRSAQDMVNLLRPMLSDHERVGGQGNQLIIKATPNKMARLKQAISQLDAKPQQLRISIQRANPSFQGDDLLLAGKVKIYQTQDNIDQQSQQSVRITDGQEVNIDVGEAVPVVSAGTVYSDPVDPDRRYENVNVDYKNMTMGFVILPRLVNDKEIKLEISQYNNSRNVGNNRFQLQSGQTTIVIPLGEWVNLSSTNRESSTDNNKLVYSTKQRRYDNADVYIKVDRLP